jgi:enoyl-CoA hydratase/carnithine racemase
MTGEPVSAEHALEYGIAYKVVPTPSWRSAS